ncbi:MAG: response regulator receiver protein [Deltaproteobacteria bacterium]|nr:response regulator receiver protein [Deltaproteobacteria bacterium]MBP2679610.1 response regulator receiver protein [Deltaproteobacteria bacterium]
MAEAIRSLIIENDAETARLIELLGRRSGSLDVRWTAGSVEEGADIVRKFHPDMAIVEVNGNPASAVGPLAKEFPNLYILALSAAQEPEYALETMRAGAHDLLCKPVREVDLSIAMEKARKARVRKEPAERRGKIVTVFSNKGGNGTTTIASNLSDALATDHGKRVVVVDLVMAHGDVTMFFNVIPTYTLLDLARNSGKADPEYIDSLIVRHSSGVCILADPPRIEDADLISADQVRDMLATLRSTFDVVIVDTPHQFDEKTLAALEMSDTILLVTLLNLPALKNTQRSIELFARLGILDDRVQLVLSRYLPNDEISRESIEGILNCPVFFAVPNDYPTVLSSINRGKLLSETAPEKEVSAAFRKMADLLVGPAVPRVEQKRKRGFLEKVFRMERSAS